jgi:hypothetical protein
MMIIVNRVGDNSLSGSVNGIPFGVSYDEKKFELMQQLQDRANAASTVDELQAIVDEFLPLTKESYKELVETICPYIMVNKHTNKFYLQYGGEVSSKALPQEFVDRILKSVEKGIDITPLIKCWARFLREVPGRPVYTASRADMFAKYINAMYTDSSVVAKLQKEEGLSEKVASERATRPQVSITQEGLLVCYKVSREIRTRYELNPDEEVVQKCRYKPSVDPDTGLVTYDEPGNVEDRLFEPYVMGNRGDEFNSGDKKGHFIRVGQRHWLDSWDQVGTPGSKGMHCGGLSYIKGYQNGEGAITHNIFVDPMDIHTIAGLGNGNDGAMTVKGYFVFSSFAGPNKNIYHSSTYAALTDEEYQKILQEVVEASKMKKDEVDKMLSEAQALGSIPGKSGTGSPTAAKLTIDDALTKDTSQG